MSRRKNADKMLKPFSFGKQETMEKICNANHKKTVLIGSPVRQKPSILAQFLSGLDETEKDGFSVTYYFVDDNVDEKSSALLKDFGADHETIIKRGDDLTKLNGYSSYVSNEVTHIWDSNTIAKVAYFKDTIIEYAIENRFDYLFLVDSDIVLDRRTLRQLASRNVEIVSNVFWTQWKPNWQLEPQCFWMPALAYQERKPFSGPIEREEARQIQKSFFAKMRIPGLYKVDGLGACTLIARSALEKGVRFQEIPNLSLLGEDRHFCIRAGALGIDLYFDTVFPVYHIYREEYLSRVDEFKQHGFRYDMCQTFEAVPKTASIRGEELARIVKKGCAYIRRKWAAHWHTSQERHLTYDHSAENSCIAVHVTVSAANQRYFERTVHSTLGFAGRFLILDETGSDEVASLCAKLLKDKPYRIIKGENNAKSGRRERYQILWEATAEREPGWILALHAGEVMPDGAMDAMVPLTENKGIDAYRFLRYAMWNDQEYREDGLWQDYRGYYSFLMRYQKDHVYDWTAGELHDERFPREIEGVSYAEIPLRVRDYEWSRAEDRQKAYKRLALAPGTTAGDSEKWRALVEEPPVRKSFSGLPKAL